MGKDLADAFPAAAEVFSRVDDALSFPLSRTIFAGPEEELKRTALTHFTARTHAFLVGPLKGIGRVYLHVVVDP